MSDFNEDMQRDALALIDKQIDELRTLHRHTHMDDMAREVIGEAIHRLGIARDFQKGMICE